MLTCLNDLLFPGVGRSIVRVLEHAGCEVVFDPRQTCCGQPAFNMGDRASAIRVARHTLRVFDGDDPVIVPSASCTTMVRWGYPQLFKGEPDCAAAVALGRRTYELAEFIVTQLGMDRWPGRYPRAIAFHRSCHMRELPFPWAAERLVGSLEGIDVRPVRESEQCCGFGGTLSVTMPTISSEMGAAKLANLEASGAEEVVAPDMACLMHLGGIIRVKESRLHVRHFAQVLDDSLKGSA